MTHFSEKRKLMDYQSNWKEDLPKDKSLPLVQILLKGYGQVMMCSNATTGAYLFLAMLLVSYQIALLSLIGVFISSMTAYLLWARPFHVNSGLYGYNGAVLGIAWPWLFPLTPLSIIIFLVLSSLSSVILKFLTERSIRTRINLPVLTTPALILVWLVFFIIQIFPQFHELPGPDKIIVRYTTDFNSNLIALLGKEWTWNNVAWGLKIFQKHLLVFVLILCGVYKHSRISTMVILVSTLFTCLLVYLAGGLLALGMIDEYFYNAVPCAAALSGVLLVYNRSTIFLSLAAVVIVVGVVYLGIHFAPFPVFIAPFNLVILSLYFLVKQRILNRARGFYAVPTELIYNPETGLGWLQGEIFAKNFWEDVEKRWPKVNPS